MSNKPATAEKLSVYLGMANNVRKNLLRLYRKQKWKLNHMYLFPVVFLYCEVLLRIFGPAGLFRSLIYPLLFSIGYGLICAALTSAFKPKINRIISMVLLYMTGLLFVVECLIRNTYQSYMTIGAILTGAGGVLTGFTGELFSAIFHGFFKIVLFFLPALLYTATGRRRMPARRYQLPFVGIVLVCALVVSGFGVLVANVGKNGDKYDTQFDFNSATQTFGLLTSTRLNTKYELLGGGPSTDFVLETEAEPSPSEVASEAEKPTVIVYGDNEMDIDFAGLAESTSDETLSSLHSYVDSLSPSSQNEYTGIFEGKNLILICAEALSDVAIHPELTPTLYRLTHNGFYFSEFYQPAWGGSTSSGEFSFIYGLAPVAGIESILNTQNNNNYFTLGNQLQRENYYSAAFHSGVYDFYDRDITHENLGYATYLGRGNGIEDLLVDYTDTSLFEGTLPTYIDKQPFSVYYMTLSGHCTYLESSNLTTKYLSRVEAVLGDTYKDVTKYYFCYQMELESALTYLVNALEEAGIADDTVICITSDHYPYGLEEGDAFATTEDYVSDLYGYTPEHEWERDRNALVIWSGCLENEYKQLACEISEPTFSLDVVPTLSNLFGLEYDSRLLVGRDVFSSAEAIVFWNTHTWVTSKGKFDAYTQEFYPNDGSDVDDNYVARIKQIVANKYNFSKQAVDTDYYGVLMGPDDITTNDHFVPKASSSPVQVISSSPPLDTSSDTSSDTAVPTP